MSRNARPEGHGMSLFTRWIEVKCQAIHHGKTCGKVHSEVTP
jgi:hypothetical protein